MSEISQPDSSQCWRGRYLDAADLFVPGRLRQDAALRARAENVVNAALMAATAGPIYALVYWLLDLKLAAVEILACCLVMLLAPPVLRLTSSIVAARELFLCALFFNFTWLTWHLGGSAAPTASWLVTAPVVAMFLGGVASGVFWLVMSCLAAGVIWSVPVLGLALPPSPHVDMQLLHMVCDLGLYVVVLVFVLLFELTKTEGFVKLKQALSTINELAIRDELTGSHNRRFLLGLVDREKERSDRNGRPFCLCLFDLDFFKRINDTYGHAAGDAVLRAFAGAVQGQIRATDAFGRYGGEEFLLMLPETPAPDAVVLAERVRRVIAALRCQHEGSEIGMTVSVGVAEYRLGETAAQAIGRADEALYLAKSLGRNRVQCHDADQRQPVVVDKPAAQGGAGASSARLLDGAHCDQLTGLLNRSLLRDRLRHAMDRAKRNRRLVALLLLNINRFKEINDELGYEAGDALLAQVGATIRSTLRDADTVARWGGDEFVALLEDLGFESDAQLVAEKIIDRLRPPLQVAGRECFVTLAVGVALFPAADCDLDALLKRADIAMREAKRWGENSVQLYTGDTAQPRCERLALKNGLREALAKGQFFLEYQPQLELRSAGERRVVGVEALLRWQHPVYGRVAPGSFISLAEETGMIVPIGDWALRTACLQNRAWRDAGLPEIKLAVNLSARQLKEAGLAARVLAILEETRMPAHCLDLEITEGMLIEDLAANCALIKGLRDCGVLVSIDDFGTGYSSLNYLSELPVDILKMDALFVRRLGAPERGRPFAIAESIVDMAHRLGLQVIAEAVELPEQLADLAAMGCDAAQGYLFARPLPPEEVAALLARQGAPAPPRAPLPELQAD
jgi:diguanylate cyclase (GGDEF)-like protein